MDPAAFTNALMPLLAADELVTPTSKQQDEVLATCLPYLTGQTREINDPNSHGIPRLQKIRHIKFLKKALEPYPAQAQKIDASRPWMMYWVISALSGLGVDVSVYRERAMETFAPLQYKDGGFGGGHGQTPHGAASYASVLCLAQVGGLDLVDRKAMWRWLGQIKQRDGGFAMAVDGEVDVRGAYCALTLVSLLNLPTHLPSDSPAYVDASSTFMTGLGEWLARCQTYEGGIGGAPGNEAHGAYVFCCLACLCILDAPQKSIPQYLNLDRLIDWLAARCMAPEGGYAGRTNKLVDACYSHWIGGCWPLVEAALADDDNHSVPGLWNRQALVRYTLCCSQTGKGGLRDKPGMHQDAYHTWYSLAGMASAQHTWTYDREEVEHEARGMLHELDLDLPMAASESRVTARAPASQGLSAAFHWRGRKASDAEKRDRAFDDGDQVELVHPVFMIASNAVVGARERFGHSLGWS